MPELAVPEALRTPPPVGGIGYEEIPREMLVEQIKNNPELVQQIPPEMLVQVASDVPEVQDYLSYETPPEMQTLEPMTGTEVSVHAPKQPMPSWAVINPSQYDLAQKEAAAGGGPPAAQLGGMAPGQEQFGAVVPGSMAIDMSALPSTDEARAYMRQAGAAGRAMSAAVAGQEDALNKSLEAERKKFAIENSQAERELELYKGGLDSQKTADNAYAKHREWAQAKTESQYAKLEELQSQYEKAHIDPNRWWTGKETGQKVAIILGLALGTAANLMGRGSTRALDMLENEINRDLRLQQNEIDMLGKRVDLSRNMLAQLQAITQDTRASYQFGTAMRWEGLRKQIEFMRLGFKDKEVEAKLMEMEAGTALKISAAKADAQKILMTTNLSQGSMALQMAQIESENSKIKFAMAAKYAGQQAQMMPGQSPEHEWLPGSMGPRNERDAAQAAAAWQEGKLVDQAMSDLIRLGEKGSRLNATEWGIADAAAAALQLHIQKVNKLGVPSAFDYAIMKTLAPNPLEWSGKAFLGISTKVLKQSRINSRRKVLGTIAGYNLRPKPGYGWAETAPGE